MAVQPDTTTGTLTTTAGSINFTTSGTQMLTRGHLPGDRFLVNGLEIQIATITGENSGTLTEICPVAAAVSGFPVRLRFQPDGARVAAQTRNLIDVLGNGTLQSLAAINGQIDDLVIFDGPNSLRPISKLELVQGVNYDVQVNTLPERSAYDNEAAGFSVLVSNVGDGRAALYIKNTATLGDWSSAAYLTGPVGPLPTLEVGAVTSGNPGTQPIVTIDPVTGGYELDFTIPSGAGFYWQNTYNSGNSYSINSVVRHNGSSFISIQAVPSGQSPSSAIPPVDNSYWQVLAIKGQDGTGIGDVVGPTSVLDGDEVIFNGATGKSIRSAGPSSPFISVSPIPINLHFGTLQGVGLVSVEQAPNFSTTVTSASSTNIINVASAANWRVGQLICYIATNGQYYSMVINSISGNTFTLNRTLPVPIANGASIFGFYDNTGHPTVSGYRTIADDALRQMSSRKTLVYSNADPTHWTSAGSGITLTPQTTAYYGNPGSMTSGQQGLLVQGSLTYTGVHSRAVQFDAGGTYETEVIVNPGNINSGSNAGTLVILAAATYPDGSTETIARTDTTAFGNTTRLVKLRYRVRKGARVTIQVLEPASATTWIFLVGMVRHFRIEENIRSLNKGKHIMFGDSWQANGAILDRLQIRLPQANFVNRGVGGNKIADLLTRFDADVGSQSPNFVWTIIGINDVVASPPTTTSAYLTGMDDLISRIQNAGAVPIIFDCQTGTISSGQNIVSLARDYAISLNGCDVEPNFPEIGTYSPEYLPGSGAFASIVYNAIRSGSYVKYADGTAYISITLRTNSISVGTATGLVTVSLPFPVFDNNLMPIRAFGFTNNPTLGYATNINRLSLVYNTGSAEVFLPVSELGTGASANTLVIGAYVRWK